MELLGGQHLGRVVRLPQPGLGRPIEFEQLQVVCARSVVHVQPDVKALHVLWLIVRDDALSRVRAAGLNQLSAIALKGGERQAAVTVLTECPVLPDELSLLAIWVVL